MVIFQGCMCDNCSKEIYNSQHHGIFYICNGCLKPYCSDCIRINHNVTKCISRPDEKSFKLFNNRNELIGIGNIINGEFVLLNNNGDELILTINTRFTRCNQCMRINYV
jgi:hypothetical protein